MRRKVNVGRRKHVVFKRPASEANGNYDADNCRPNFCDAYIRDKRPVGGGASNCAKRVEIASLENTRDVAKKYVAKHTATNARNAPHQNDREGKQMIYQGFIGTNNSKEANGDNVGPLKHARESIKRLREHKEQHGS